MELVCCFGSGLDCVPLGLEMLVRESLRCGEGQGGCGLGTGSQEAAPGVAVRHGKSQQLLLATPRWLAWPELRVWAKY